MYRLVFLGIVGVAISQTSTDLTHCPGSVPRNNYLRVYGGKCIQFVLTERSWVNASADCKSRGGNLVMIKNNGKQEFVYNTLKSLHWHYNGLWIGGSDSDREGIWVWVDGTPLSFGNWHPGQGPTAHNGFFFSSSNLQDCAQMRLDDGGKWHDYPCGGLHYSYVYVCEYALSSTVVTKAAHPHTTSRSVPKRTPRPGTTLQQITTLRPQTTPHQNPTVGPRATLKPGHTVAPATTARLITQSSTDLTHCPGAVPRNNYLKVYGGKCLQFVLTERSWVNASADCKSRGGNLVMIKNAGKQEFVYNTLKSLHWRYDGLWIGGSDSDREGIWVWVDGTPMSFGNWHPGQGPTAHNGFFFPSSAFEDCAQMRLDDGGKWHDYSCGRSYSYICEYENIYRPSKHPPTTAKLMPTTTTTLSTTTTVILTTTEALTTTTKNNCSSFHPLSTLVKYYGNTCLRFVKNDKSWNDANAECVSQGGHLLQIHSQMEQDFIFESLTSLHWSDSGAWIGASDRGSEGQWKWTDDSPVEYGNWKPGEGPSHNATNENCAMINVDDGMWYDYDCGSVIYNQAYICQYSQ